MLRRVVLTAALAGGLAALALSLVQQWQVVPLILEAEGYEAGAGHGPAPWTPGRLAMTLAANAVLGVGFGLVLAALFAFREPADWREGALWGVGGFLAFGLAPALGLAPELPGAAAADLGARQLWWLATALCTAAGLALLVFAPRRLLKLGGLAALVAPHLVGAPHAGDGAGLAPPELAARYAVASLFATAVFWVALGTLAGAVWRRLAPTAPGSRPDRAP